jgi:hypothetical protein
VGRLRIIRRSALSEFAHLVSTYRQEAYRLWLISPWIGVHTDGSVDPLQLMIDSVATSSKCIVTVVTRKPLKNATYHQNAIQLLRENMRPSLFYCDTLHTKLYVLQADGVTAAVLGSPNLTAGGNTANIELAIEIRDTLRGRLDEVGRTLQGLVYYAHDLLAENGVTLAN